MKKSLLSLAMGLTFGAAFAQDTLIVFNGTTGVANGKPYAFDGAPIKVTKDTIQSLVVLHLSTTAATSGYAGGGGVGGYSQKGDLLPLGYTGTVANSLLQFKVSTPLTGPALQIQFKTSDGTIFGKNWNFKDSTSIKTGYGIVTAPVSSLKLKSKAGVFDSTVVTDEQLQDATSEIQFVVSYTGPKTDIYVDDLFLINTEVVAGLEDETLTSSDFNVYPNPNHTGVINLGENAKSYSLSTISGAIVKEGVGNTINVEGIEKGVYFVRVGNKTTKVVLN